MKRYWPNYSDDWKNRLVVGVGAAASVLGLITLVLMFTGLHEKWPDWPKYALAFWVVVPPLCFWAEYWLLWRHEPHEDPKELERFKYAQELGRNVWLAFVILLGAFYFSESKAIPGHRLPEAKEGGEHR
jgi:hypothetical protein